MEAQQGQWYGQQKAVKKNTKDARKPRPPPGEWALKNLPSGEADAAAPSLQELASTLNAYRRRMEDHEANPNADPIGAENAANLTSRALLQAQKAALELEEGKAPTTATAIHLHLPAPTTEEAAATAASEADGITTTQPPPSIAATPSVMRTSPSGA